MLCKVKDKVARVLMVTTPFNFISYKDNYSIGLDLMLEASHFKVVNYTIARRKRQLIKL